jgi:DNA-binding SARP family transcriptional activator/tetratricopeptide (TPR) repeat protein
MQVNVLGPLEVRVDGEPVGVSGPLPRRLLALLTARAGQDVSVDQLIEEVWAEPSDAARATLHSHVARLRRSLGRTEFILQRTGRYRLDIDPEEVDANAFIRSLEEGRRAAQSGDSVSVVNAIGRGLDLWRGRAYEEFDDCPALAGESRRLDRARLDGLETYFAAQLEVNELVTPTAELEALVQDHPTRERLSALLMKALYRSGRQADALAAFRRVRGLLVDELGIEPGPELRDLEMRVLQQDPSLLPGRRADPMVLAPAHFERWDERRTVTVMTVARRSQPDPDPEKFARTELELRKSIERLAEPFGGVLLPHVRPHAIVFGAPRAHEDDPLRAIAAAAALAEAELGAAIGVSTGEVLADAAGSNLRGGPLTRSAELAAAASGGQILTDSVTGESVAGWVSVASVGPDTVDVRVGSLAEPTGPRPTTARLVGRQYELSLVSTAYARSRHSHKPTLVTVVGEAGVGKSRLVSESALLLRHDNERLKWLTGCCIPYGDQSGLRPLAEIIRNGLGIPDRSRSVDVETRVASVIPAREVLLAQLNLLLGGDSLAGASRGESFAAWAGLLDALAGEAPTVALFEDLQWAAPLVLDFLEYVITSRRGAPLLVLGTARPELLEQRPAWAALPSSLLIRLDPLSPKETTELMDELLGPGGPSGTGRTNLALRSAGLPLYAEELARWAQEGETGSDEMPARLSAVIAGRLDTLPVGLRSLLGAAAVVEGAFWADQLAHVLSADVGEVELRLSALATRAFIRPNSDGGPRGGQSFVFHHDLVRVVMLHRLPRPEQAQVHLALADWWLDQAGQPDDVADQVGHHAGTAYDLAREVGDSELANRARYLASRALCRAGQRLQGIDTSAATALLQRAFQLAEGDSDLRARAGLWLGAVTFDQRRFEEAIALLRPALEEFEAANDPLRVDAATFLVMSQFSLGQDLGGLEGALSLAVQELPPGVPAVRALSILAMLKVMRQTSDSLQEATSLADRALALAVDYDGCGAPLARAVRGRAVLGLGDASGLEELERALPEVATQESGSIVIGLHQWRAGALHHWRGPEAEWQARAELEATAADRGLQFIISMGVAEDVRVLYEMGRLREAIAMAEEIGPEEEAQPRWATIQRAIALLEMGELDETTLRAALDTPPADDGDLRHLLGRSLLSAGWDLWRGSPIRAASSLRVLSPVERFVARDGALELLPRLVRTALAADSTDMVYRLSGIDAVATPLRRLIQLTVTGLQAVAVKQPSAAIEPLEQAVHGWQSFGNRVEAAYAERDLALCLERTDNPRAAGVRAHAEAELAAIGIVNPVGTLQWPTSPKPSEGSRTR